MPTQDMKPPYGLQTSEAAHTLAHTVRERYLAVFQGAHEAVCPWKIID